MKKSIGMLLLLAFAGKAQEIEIPQEAPTNWYHLDFKKDGFFGISSKKAYNELLKDKPSSPVIVAVIDSGIEIDHEDLKDVIWVNPKEIPNNGIDDDKNGFIDDIHGWDFIGGKDGKDIQHETLEITRFVISLAKKFNGKDSLAQREKFPKEYKEYQSVYASFHKKYDKDKAEFEQFSTLANMFKGFLAVAKKKLNVPTVTKALLDTIKYDYNDPESGESIVALHNFLDNGFDEKQLNEGEAYFNAKMKYQYNMDYNGREPVGDNPEKLEYLGYGNNEVEGPDADHGTHVAGIIAASRNNQKGIDGIASNVKIMVLRAVPDGDERDKDIANSIRYAADNGAKIINMSFGKPYSPQKQYVDEAVKYAQEKGVLFIHAAGNDSQNIDIEPNFPTHKLLDGTRAEQWITIGANSWKSNKSLVAMFSNFGKKGVDVFAPGVDIYSTTINNSYVNHSGTSMAAPVVAGVAATLWSYFPKLTAKDIKDIILESSVKLKEMQVMLPGSMDNVLFGNLSLTGGIVNLYEAVLLANKR